MEAFILEQETLVYYRNNTMTDWEIYDNNLPKSTTSTQPYTLLQRRKII